MAIIDPTLTELFNKQFPSLSQHEASCLSFYVQGSSRKEIAGVLSVTESSVTNALERVQKKFNVTSTSQLRTIVLVTLYLRVLEALK